MRLNDADEFIKKFSYAKDNTQEENTMCATVRRMVKEQPTAYDMENVLEQSEQNPAVAEAKAALLRCGALAAQMTGSGSAVFGVFAEEAAAQQCRESLEREGRQVFLTHPVSFGVEILNLE